MLWGSQAEKVVTEAMRAAHSQADAKRKERAVKQLLLYQDEQKLYIKAELVSNCVNY